MVEHLTVLYAADGERLYTTAQAAARLGVSPAAVRHYLAAHSLEPDERRWGRLWFRASTLAAFTVRQTARTLPTHQSVRE